MGNETIQVLVVGSGKSEVACADVIDGLVVNHERTIGMLKGGVGGENGVVRLNDRGSSLGSRIDAELKLALLSVVHREALHEQGTETRTSTTTEGVENQEALESGAVVGNSSNLVEDGVDQLLADSVVSTSIVVGSILLSADHLLWVEETAVGSGADLVDDIGLKIAIDGTGNVFALAFFDMLESALSKIRFCHFVLFRDQ